MTKQEIRTTGAPTPGGSYSQGIVAGGFLFTAGMGPIDPATGEIVGDDIVTQTHQVLKNVGAVLSAHGLGFAHVVKSTVHLQELQRDFPLYDEVYRSYLTAPYPVRTTVGSQLLGILVEIDVVAFTSRSDG
jgi:2-iminobutanoate/2-iminopropanoate deaminase